VKAWYLTSHTSPGCRNRDKVTRIKEATISLNSVPLNPDGIHSLSPFLPLQFGSRKYLLREFAVKIKQGNGGKLVSSIL
jgi:hypothetical protein